MVNNINEENETAIKMQSKLKSKWNYKIKKELKENIN